MSQADQVRMAEEFRARHARHPVLLLPNAWDGMSARLFVAAGFEAIATTSGGVAWALGWPDGETAPWAEVVAATARIARAARVAVTADIEAGYGATPQEVAAHIGDIIAAGAVGINLEDGLHTPQRIRTPEDAARRIRAAREAARQAGVPIVINARTVLYYLQLGEPAWRFAETVARAKSYLEAGADCIYPFGVRDAETIAALAAAIPAPVNITGRAGMPDAAALEALGVRRITIAAAPTLVAMSAIRTLAEELYANRRFDALAAPLKHPDAQSLFAAIDT
jgi:2-methylisocitrate lyase-like PEP mutase family enzyme